MPPRRSTGSGCSTWRRWARRPAASRWLADYGAEVVKVGPVPAQGGVQITPPFYAYSAHRGTASGCSST